MQHFASLSKIENLYCHVFMTCGGMCLLYHFDKFKQNKRIWENINCKDHNLNAAQWNGTAGPDISSLFQSLRLSFLSPFQLLCCCFSAPTMLPKYPWLQIDLSKYSLQYSLGDRGAITMCTVLAS